MKQLIAPRLGLAALMLLAPLAACCCSSGGGGSRPTNTYVVMPNGQTVPVQTTTRPPSP